MHLPSPGRAHRSYETRRNRARRRRATQLGASTLRTGSIAQLEARCAPSDYHGRHDEMRGLPGVDRRHRQPPQRPRPSAHRCRTRRAAATASLRCPGLRDRARVRHLPGGGNAVAVEPRFLELESGVLTEPDLVRQLGSSRKQGSALGERTRTDMRPMPSQAAAGSQPGDDGGDPPGPTPRRVPAGEYARDALPPPGGGPGSADGSDCSSAMTPGQR